MFRKDPEKTQLVTEKGTMYSITMESVSTDEIMQMEKDSNINHCHDNSQATEDREREKQLARKRLYVVSAVCLVFMIGEILGGYFAGSLAVMTDAAHLLVDFASFIISLVSLWLSSRPATRTLSYGWHRAEILGALLSVVTIWLVTGVLVYLAVQRLIRDNYEIEGTIMLITSGCAVLANIIMAFTLHQSGHGHSHGGLSSGHSHSHGNKDKGNHGHSHAVGDRHGHSNKSNHSHGNGNQENHSHGNGDVEQHGGVDVQRYELSESQPQANASVRAAFVHVVGDLLQSISVLVSAIIIFFKPEYKIADPICTFLFSIFVLGTTITILRDILIVLMEGTPAGVKHGEVRDRLLAVKGVKSVHSLHIWALTMNQTVLSAHVAIDDLVDSQPVLREMTQTCFSNYNFHSVTIQLEQQSDQKPGCSLCDDPKI
ncbi:proton-coupled zinc antiporter SLC30A8-like isoform X1 [Salvelinus fontinalis]|uniref:proton-coupled zinc antiporter SLC30A8-like isoform X1 n=2 Tax=Salvelinus fontinalis TaxID=8038 RepID=UPI002484E61E|nr:proton-coupled zinc antiporter SLC30A8-like isoform X1 [Salvelinus fontinalis]